MSYLQHIKKASKDKSEDPNTGKPEINRFSDIESINQRRHQVLDYLVLGCTTPEISDYMGESEAVVKKDIEEIYKVGYQARDEDLEFVRDEIMRMYRTAAKEGFKGFKLSQGEVEKITEEYDVSKERSADKSPNKTKTVTEELAGDPRFLSVMIDAGKEMGKLSGAQKHKEVEIQNNVQNNNAVQILSPNRTRMPEDFDRWTKKPEDASVPSIDKENEDIDAPQESE